MPELHFVFLFQMSDGQDLSQPGFVTTVMQPPPPKRDWKVGDTVEGYDQLVVAEDLLPCEKCQSFNPPPGMWRHLLGTHRKICTGFYENCPLCVGKVTMVAYYDYTGFRSEGELADHMRRVHGPDRIKRVDCEYCTNTFKTFIDLELHLASFHPGKKVKFSCDLCDTSTATLREMGLHRAEVHDVKKAYACHRTRVNGEPCTVSFKSWYELNAHQKKAHDSPRPAELPPAEPRMKEPHTAELHPAEPLPAEPHSLRTEKTRTCDECGYQAVSPSALVLHGQVSHNIGRKIECADCDFFTFAPIRFTSHRLSHGPKKFVCRGCDYSTAYKQSMKRHMATAKHE
jgi:hypothetical protein